MPPPLLTQLEGRIPLPCHEHVAVLYRGREAAFRLVSFLAEGLGRGDLCLYLAPDTFHAEMLARLRALGIDVEASLYLRTLRLNAGAPTFQELRQWTQEVFAEAEEKRVPALRWLEEGLWPEPVGLPMRQFFEFHAILNYQVKHYASAALCQYALDRIDPHDLFCAIAVHRHLLVEDTLVRDNPFYIPAEKFIPLEPKERERDLVSLFREVGFDVEKLLAAIVGYGRLHADEPGDT